MFGKVWHPIVVGQNIIASSYYTQLTVINIAFPSLQTDKAEKIEYYIHTGITKAISCHCNFEFPATFIRSGIFLCWNAQDEVTYRSVIVGTEDQSATELLDFLENWVKSKPVLQVEKFGLWVSSEYPVRITSLGLSNPQCPSTTGESTTETPTTVNPTPDKD